MPTVFLMLFDLKVPALAFNKSLAVGVFCQVGLFVHTELQRLGVNLIKTFS